MLYPNCTADLLGLKYVIVTKVEHSNNQVHVVWLEPILQMQVCPACRHETKRTHSYREQLVRDLTLQGMHCILYLRKRRYYCPHYGFVFREKLDEFKGNAGGRKFQCILADPVKHMVMDILVSCYGHAPSVLGCHD